MARRPNQVAVVCENESLTYAELDQQAESLAGRLRRVGVGPEAHVGLCAEPSIDLVIGILGILKAGGAYVPLDPDLPIARLQFMVEDSEAGPVLAQDGYGQKLEAGGATVLPLETFGDQSNPSADRSLPVAEAGSLAYVIYTSGSTGRPKGCLVEHGNVVRLFESTRKQFGFDEHDVWTLFHSFAFDFSVWELWGALLHGGKLVVVPRRVRRNPTALWSVIKSERVTVLNQTPSAFYGMIAALDSAASTDSDLRYVIFAGEALDTRRLAAWFDLQRGDGPQLINMYGITETTVHVTYLPLTEQDCATYSRDIGRPIDDLYCYVVDQHGEIAPPDTPGELWVGGAGVARGYLNRPELTAERFIPDPFGADGGRLYRSGDLASQHEDGNLEYLGRIDHQVQVHGFRIELGEIESALNDHRCIDQSVVVAAEDTFGDKRLAAYFVSRSASPPSAETLREHLLASLPEYMVPSAFAALTELPLTANGKVDRKALPAAGFDRSRTDRRYVSAGSETERRLLSIWTRLLELDGNDRFGVEDDFFAAGGTSLLAVHAAVQASAELETEVDLDLIYRYPTVAALAQALSDRSAPKVGGARLRPRVGGPELMGYSQWLFWFDSSIPHESVTVEATEARAEHVDQLASMLRARFTLFNFRPMRLTPRLQPMYEAPSEIIHHDLGQLEGASQPAAIAERIARAKTDTDFFRRNHPMFRVLVFQLGSGRAVISVVFSHLCGGDRMSERHLRNAMQRWAAGEPESGPSDDSIGLMRDERERLSVEAIESFESDLAPIVETAQVPTFPRSWLDPGKKMTSGLVVRVPAAPVHDAIRRAGPAVSVADFATALFLRTLERECGHPVFVHSLRIRPPAAAFGDVLYPSLRTVIVSSAGAPLGDPGPLLRFTQGQVARGLALGDVPLILTVSATQKTLWSSRWRLYGQLMRLVLLAVGRAIRLPRCDRQLLSRLRYSLVAPLNVARRLTGSRLAFEVGVNFLGIGDRADEQPATDLLKQIDRESQERWSVRVDKHQLVALIDEDDSEVTITWVTPFNQDAEKRLAEALHANALELVEADRPR